MRRGRKKGANKEKVFGCDLLEHLTACSQEIPPVLRSCSEFIEEHGVVDGIYRLSGVSSNIQKLRSEFDSDSSPDLHKELYLQDIHCVSSLCKAYFRELPNPLLTYQLYDKFAEAVAIQLEEERLVKIKDVLKELPLPHHRTLEFLMCHLVKMASHSLETNMHARNLAIVWAPNLLRSKDIETSGFNGTAAFMEVRVQSIVVEFILTHVPQLFPEQAGVQAERRNSLPSPTAESSQEETLLRRHHASVQCTSSYGNISPGDGPLAMRSYHSIIENTEKRKGSLKGRKWMSIFNIGGRFHDQRRRNKHSTKEKSSTSLRPARSMDCLISPSCTNDDGSRHPAQRPPSTHLSPLAVPSPQLGSEVTAGGLGGSGYAVTYRRGTGVVSGGSGTQGTYNLLDPKGAGTTGATEGQPHQSRSPGMSSKTGRRAAMHITGPQYVTVPLHITSNLAMMLQGGGGTVIHYGREKDRGGDRADGKEGGGKVQLKAAGGEMEQGKVDGRADVKVEDMKGDEQNGQTVRQEEEEAERGREEKCSADEEVKGVEETDVGVKEKRDEEVEREECLSEPPQEEGADSREKEQGSEDHNSSMEENGDDDDDNDEDTEDEEDDEYMEMKACQHIATAPENPEMEACQHIATAPENPESPVSEAGVCGDDDSGSDLSHILNSTEVEDDAQELSGYVQDNFNFLDDMDCSVSNQINEFSVEAPFYENEYEFMEVPRLPSPPSTETAQRPRAETAPQLEAQIPTPVRSHRTLSADACHRHTKSLSLPFMSPPFFPVAMSSEDDDEEEEEEEDDDDEDDMFYKSLPAGYMLSNLTWSAPGADGEDPSSPPLTALEPQSVIVNTIHVGESQSSEPTPLDSECATHNELNVERMEQGELNDQEEPEQRSQLKGGDEVEEEEEQEEDPDSEMQIQNTATEDIHHLVDAGVTEESGAPCDKPFTSESLAACHEGFPTPRTEDNDETNNLACMQIIDEAQNMALNSHPISETVSYSMQEETVDLSAEILEDSSESVPELHKIDVTTDREEVREREGNTVEEGINTVEGMNMVQNQAQEEQEISLVLRKDSQSSDLKITESDEEKLEGDDDLGNHDIWSESEDIICEKYDKSKHGEEKDAGEDVCNVKEGDEQTGQEHEEVGQEAGKGTTKERKEKDDVEAFKAEVTTDMVMEEGTDLSLVEGLPSEDQETVPDVQRKEIDSPLVEREIDLPPETYATQEEEKPWEHEQDEDDGNSSEQEIQSEQKATNEEQPQALMVVGEKEKTQSEVNTEGTGVPGEGKSEDEEMESRPRSEAGVGRTLMISKQTCKVYHSRTVPVVPPKPQHCRLTALSLRQQQDRWDADRERESSSRAAVAEHKERDADEAGTGGQDKVCTGEQGACGEGHEESMRGRKERPALKAGGKESEKRRDGDDGPTPRHGPSMCFDEAVAMATMRRERERKRYSGHEVQ